MTLAELINKLQQASSIVNPDDTAVFLADGEGDEQLVARLIVEVNDGHDDYIILKSAE